MIIQIVRIPALVYDLTNDEKGTKEALLRFPPDEIIRVIHEGKIIWTGEREVIFD